MVQVLNIYKNRRITTGTRDGIFRGARSQMMADTENELQSKGTCYSDGTQRREALHLMRTKLKSTRDVLGRETTRVRCTHPGRPPSWPKRRNRAQVSRERKPFLTETCPSVISHTFSSLILNFGMVTPQATIPLRIQT